MSSSIPQILLFLGLAFLAATQLTLARTPHLGLAIASLVSFLLALFLLLLGGAG